MYSYKLLLTTREYVINYNVPYRIVVTTELMDGWMDG